MGEISPRKLQYGRMTRRGFLVLGVAGSALALTRLRGGDEAAEGELAPTESDIEGPFYREDAPFTDKLRSAETKAPALFVSGVVRGTPGGAPLKEAIVDVWHADEMGHYDNEDSEDAKNFRFRGQMKTDKDGAYAFETIVPAAYRTGGESFRPAHIHYKVRAKGYRELTTQLYFKGDPHLSKDRWAKKSNTKELVKHEAKEDLAARKLETPFYTCVFDIVLRKK